MIILRHKEDVMSKSTIMPFLQFYGLVRQIIAFTENIEVRFFSNMKKRIGS